MATYSPSKITKDGNTYNFTDATKIPLSGTNALAGSIVPDTDNAYDFGSSTYKLRYVYADTAYVTNLNINGSPAGDILTHNASEFVPRSGGAVLEGDSYSKTVNDSFLQISGGKDYRSGTIKLFGINSSSSAGHVRFFVSNYGMNGITYYFEHHNFATSGHIALGYPGYEWGQIYSTNSTISTSDQRQKQQINSIDDKLLNAWENVNIVQFKFNNSVEEKGDNARLHTGYIAQNIQQACKEKGVNPNDYGLFCFDEWEEQEEKKNEKGEIVEHYRPKGDLYSLRYEEALVVECAYLRKKNKELQEQLNKVIARLDKLEGIQPK